MPRALLAVQPTEGGAAVCVRDLAAAAVEAGWDVTVTCGPEHHLAEWVRAAGCRWIDVGLGANRRPAPSDAAAFARLRSAVAASDVVHLHSSKAGALGRLAVASMPARSRPGCVFTPHGWSWLVGGPMERAYQAFERWAAHRADAIVAVSDDERQTGLAVLGPRVESRIRVISNGVDVQRFAPRLASDGRRDGPPTIVCIARLTQAKGQDVAVRAVAAMSDRTARLRLVGDGPTEVRRRLTDLVDELGLRDRVTFAGHVADPRPELTAADVVIVPSRWDGLSLSLLEAMAAGAAIVATRVSGSSAVDGAGVIVAPEDPRALAEGIDRLLADPAERDRLGKAARARAVEQFDVRHTTARTLMLWDEVCPARGRPA